RDGQAPLRARGLSGSRGLREEHDHGSGADGRCDSGGERGGRTDAPDAGAHPLGAPGGGAVHRGVHEQVRHGGRSGAVGPGGAGGGGKGGCGGGEGVGGPEGEKAGKEVQGVGENVEEGGGGRHTPFFNGYRPQFYFRTTDVTGVGTLPEGREMVMPGDNVDITVELITPIAMEKELRFAIREGGRTVGAGVVTEIVE